MIVRALDLLHSKVLPAAVSKYTTCHGTRPNPSPPTISILKIFVITTRPTPTQTARGQLASQLQQFILL